MRRSKMKNAALVSFLTLSRTSSITSFTTTVISNSGIIHRGVGGGGMMLASASSFSGQKSCVSARARNCTGMSTGARHCFHSPVLYRRHHNQQQRNVASSSSLLSSSSSSSPQEFQEKNAQDRLSHTILDPLTTDKSQPDTDADSDNNSDRHPSNPYPYTNRDMQEAITTAEKAALLAGQIMIQTSGKIAVSKTKMNASDLVTESDIECQRIVKETIQTQFPQDGFLGEEDVGAGSMASSDALQQALSQDSSSNSNSNSNKNDNDDQGKLLWIVDPIDGTTNFQAGLPIFCISIGIVSLEGDQPVVVGGVIYNPVLKEMLTAVRGRGCYLNGRRIGGEDHNSIDNDDDASLDEGVDLKQALINIGFPISSPSTLRASSKAVAALATRVRGIRMMASASQVLSWVAQGKLSAYVSWDLNAWDVAAGMVAVEEAGGFVGGFGRVGDGDGLRSAGIEARDLIVTCKEPTGDGRDLYRQIYEILKENDCLEY